jgi:hypothetical protein
VRYLASPKNIVGSVLALVGLALYFVGVIGGVWPFVVVALYAIGAILAPGPRRYDLAGNFDPDEVKSALAHNQRLAQGRLPAPVMARLLKLQQEISDLIPFTAQFPTGSQDLHVIQRTATDYDAQGNIVRQLDARAINAITSGGLNPGIADQYATTSVYNAAGTLVTDTFGPLQSNPRPVRRLST